MANPQRYDISADEELHVLEQMISARCAQIERCAQQALSRSRASRERDFQLQAFIERRDMAKRELCVVSSEPTEIRIARLESIAQALECSWDYFRSRIDVIDSGTSDAMADWAACVR